MPGARDKLEPDEKVVAELRDRDRAAALAEIRRLSQWYADDSDAAFDDLGSASDNELVGRPEILEPLRRWMREGARQGSAGYEADWIAEWGPWGFSVADIVPDAYVWWGDADALVGRSHTDYLAKTLQRSTVMTYPGEGHLFPVNHWAEMLGALR